MVCGSRPNNKIYVISGTPDGGYTGTGDIWEFTPDTLTSGVETSFGVPEDFALEQNYPNPFNPTTVIRYHLPAAASVTLAVHDVLGREVTVLVNQRMDAGVHEVTFDGRRTLERGVLLSVEGGRVCGNKAADVDQMISTARVLPPETGGRCAAATGPGPPATVIPGHPDITQQSRKGKAMKTVSLALLLMACAAFVLVGCSDNPAGPVSPTDQPAQVPIPLEKHRDNPDFTFREQNDGFDHNPEKWLAGKILHMRNVHAFEIVQATDPRVTGRMEHYLSLSLNIRTGEGPCHGSFTLAPEGMTDGIWEGTYEGYRSKTDNPFVFTLPLKLVAHGRGGSIEGMQAKMTITLTVLTNAAYYPAPIYWYGTDGVGFMNEH